jgi:hypothetical protein
MAATAEGNALSKAERERMCRGKRKFRREGDAIMAIARGQRSGRFAQGCRVYRCRVCPSWHVGPGNGA